MEKNKPPLNPGKHTTIDRQVELFDDIDNYIETHDPNGPTSIFLAVAQKIGLRFSQWSQLLKEWEYCPSSGIRDTRTARTHARSNLNKDLLNPNGTWDAMIKLLKAIRVVRIDLKITCHFNWRKPTTVDLSFDTGVPKPFGAPVPKADISEEEIKRKSS